VYSSDWGFIVKRILWVILLSLLFLTSSGFAQPVQWAYEAGGNGHWYELLPSSLTDPYWGSCSSYAASLGYKGQSGHLVTIASQEENDWLKLTILEGQAAYIGGRQSSGSYSWVTGEPFDYTDVCCDGCYSSNMWLYMDDSGWSCGDGLVVKDFFIVEFPSGDSSFDEVILLDDIPDDQGGFLSLTWGRSGYDAPSLPDSITTYHAQRFQNDDWANLISVAATHADTYQVVVPTPDVMTVGEPEPFSVYRVVASSSDPTKFYLSAVDSAYSIDDLAPPKPDVSMIEGDNLRLIVCSPPGIPDLGQVCVFRDIVSGFPPTDPIHCSDELVFSETQLINFFYRIQIADTHGNLSEFSDEVTLADPSAVGALVPGQFSLQQNHPNPFNPSTIISFTLPSDSSVQLRIYDVAGKLVRDLIDGQTMWAGTRQAVWDGRDDGGKAVSAGVYFYRLDAGQFSQTKRMTLVK